MLNIKGKYLKNHGAKLYTAMDQGMVSGFAFILQLVLAGWLGISNYGTFALLWIIVLFLNNVNQALITMPMMTLAARQSNIKRYLFAVAILQGILFPFYFVVLIIAKTLAFPYFQLTLDYSQFTAFVSLALSYQVYDFLRKSYFSNQKIKQAILLDSATICIQIAALIMIYFSMSPTLQNILWALTASYFISFVLVCYLHYSIDLPEIIHTFQKHWHFGNWLLATSMIQWLSGNFVFLLTGNIVGSAAVGILKIGQSLVGAVTFLFQVLENYLPPKASRIYHQFDIDRLWKEMRVTLSKMGVVVIILAALLAAFAYPLASWLYSTEIAQNYQIYQGFCLWAVLYFPTFIYRIGFRTIEKNYYIFIAFILHISLSAIFSYVLIPTEGLYGAIWAMILAKFGMVIFYIIAFNKQRKSKFMFERVYLPK